MTGNAALFDGATDALGIAFGNANGAIILTGNTATDGNGGAIDAYGGTAARVANTTDEVTPTGNG